MSVKSRINIIIATICLIIPLTFGMSNHSAQAKYVGHHEFPTEIRGTWYMGNKIHGRYQQIPIKITKDTLLVDKVPFLSTKYNDCDGDRAYIVKHPKSKTGFAGTVYTLGKGKDAEQSLMWLSHRKVNGKRVLMECEITNSKSHQHADIDILTRTKVNHNYSYHYRGTNAQAKKIIGY